MNLRLYQLAAVDAVHGYLNTHATRNPCVVIPTGGGKTPVIATLCKDIASVGGRVVVLAHVKELLEQTADKLRLVDPMMPVGIYSAGLRRKDHGHFVTVAGIQSIGKKACEVGAFDLVIIDEAHMIPMEGDGLYRTFIKDAKLVNPHLRVVGLTATPYRLKHGLICGESNILQDICYEVGVKELMDDGYLSPLRSKGSRQAKVDTSTIRTQAGEFIAGDAERLMNTDALVNAAVDEVLTLAEGRKSVLVFCCGKEHAGHVRARLVERGQSCGCVTDESSPLERASQLADFKEGRLRFMTNVNVLTTGFDAPNVDCVVMLRPTMSAGLYYQMVGRGFRKCEGKDNCLVLDFSGNVMRHGPVDSIVPREVFRGNGTGKAPTKECPECYELIPAGCSQCPACEYDFPEEDSMLKHDVKASDAAILSVDQPPDIREVREIGYYVHQKKNDPKAPTTLRVEYGFDRFGQRVSEWVCFNHTGHARYKAELWWKQRSKLPVPPTTEVAQVLGDMGALAEPLEATVQPSKLNPKWLELVRVKLGPKPEPTEAMLSVLENALGKQENETKLEPAWMQPKRPIQVAGVELKEAWDGQTTLSDDEIPF